MTKRRVLWFALALAAGCLDGVTPPPASRVARLAIEAPDSALLVGHALQLSARAWDSTGTPITPGGLIWWSSDTTRLRVDDAGLTLAPVGSPGGDVDVRLAAPPSPTVGVLRLHVAVPGEVKWRLSLGPMPVMGGPAQGPDGTLYVLTSDQATRLPNISTLHAVSPHGVLRWSRTLTGVRNTAPFVGVDGTICVVGQRVWAFDPTGLPLWESAPEPNEPTGDAHFGAISAGGVVYAALEFDLLALRAADGDTVWRGTPSAVGAWFPPPAIAWDGRTIYANRTTDSVFALDAAPGIARWRVPEPDEIYTLAAFGVGPTLDRARLIVPVAEQLQELDTSGTLVAIGPNLGRGMSEPAISPNGTLYVQVPQNNGLYAFDPADVEHWHAPAFRSRWSWYGGPALAAGDVLYAAAIDGFYALDLSPSGAAVRWRFPIAATDSLEFVGAPLIGPEGTVYSFTSCTSGAETIPCSAELFAFWADLPPAPNSPWPMWRHDARRSGQAPVVIQILVPVSIRGAALLFGQ